MTNDDCIARRKRWDRVYRENLFNAQSRSGSGSSLEQTAAVRRELPKLMQRLEVRTLLDAACGDFFWMRALELNVQYVGIDIVEEAIARNQQAFGCDRRRFERKDIIREALPQADLILCRDCLVHMNDADIVSTLGNFKASGARYLLATTFIGRGANGTFNDGAVFDWRPLDLTAPPFSFPPPIEVIDEECTEMFGAFRDKSLGLWRLEALPL